MKNLITRLASALPQGSEDRRTLLKMARGTSQFQVQFEKANKLDQVDQMVAQNMVESGLSDGSTSDDKIQVSKGSWPAASLKPSQTSMVLPKALGMALFMLSKGQVGGDLGALVSSDGHILDGHHRWAATILASGSKGKVGGYGAKLPGKDLLRVLNVATKGLFKVRNGKSGTGDLAGFTPDNVRTQLEEFVEKGIGGEFPVPAEKVKGILEKTFGSVEEGVNQMSQNAALITRTAPSWAPDRKQMPVIEPENVPKAVSHMTKGLIDWNDPYVKQALARLASALPKGSEVRRSLLRISSQAKVSVGRHLREDYEGAQDQGFDTPFYVEEEDGDWMVFGDSTGHAYGSFGSQEEAEERATKMNRGYLQWARGRRAVGPSQFGGKTLADAERAFSKVLSALSDAEGGMGFGDYQASAEDLINTMISDLREILDEAGLKARR